MADQVQAPDVPGDTWHIGGPPSFTPHTGPDPGRWTSESVVHLPVERVVPAIRGYCEKPVSAPIDLDEDVPWGSLWRGADQAAHIIKVVRRAMGAVDWSVLNAYAPGMAAVEEKQASKIGRLDGELTGEWSHPESLLEDGVGGARRRHRSEARWMALLRRWRDICARCSSERMPVDSTGDAGWAVPTTDYAARMLRFDGTTHHGCGTHDSGYNRSSIAAHVRVALALMRKEIRYEDFARAIERMTGTEPYALQFRRLQGGRKPVPVYRFDPELGGGNGGLALAGTWMNRNPRFRAVWAPGLWVNIMWKEATGRSTTLLRSTRFTQVRAEVTNAIVRRWLTERMGPTQLRVAARMGIKHPDRRQIIAWDYSQMDLHLESTLLSAAAKLIAATVRGAIPAAHVASIVSMPVITPRQHAAAAAARMSRMGTMLSGWQPTNLADTDANGGNLLGCFEEAYDQSAEDVDEALECGLIDALLAGDDTLIVMPAEWDAQKFKAASEAAGLPGDYDAVTNFLARWLTGRDGDYTYSMPRQVQNQLFEEEKSRQTNPYIILAGMVQRRHLIRKHPLRHVFDDIMLQVSPDVFRVARTMSVADIPSLLRQAQAHGGGDRVAKGMASMMWGLGADDPLRGMTPAGVEGPRTVEEQALDTIASMLGRRTVDLTRVVAAVDASPMTLNDALSVFAHRMTRAPLPPMLKAASNVNWR